MARFLTRGLGGKGRDALRRHVADCEDCNVLYRQSVQATAQLGRGTRAEREEKERVQRRRTQRQMAMGASLTGGGRNHMRLLLWPAIFALLVIVISRAADVRQPGIQLSCLAGRLESSMGELEVGDEDLRLLRGGWVRTGGAGTARLERGTHEMRLGASSEALVEVSRGVPRVRLVTGSLELEGSAVVPTPFGVVELTEGRAYVVLRGGTLHLVAHAGELSLVGPLGLRQIPAGSELHMESPTQVAQQ